MTAKPGHGQDGRLISRETSRIMMLPMSALVIGGLRRVQS
jgi:hypothetical protein